MYKSSGSFRSIKPLPGKIITPMVDEPVLEILDNGIKTYCIDAGEEEVCRIDIVIGAGSAFQEKRLVATSTGKMLKEGSAEFDSSAIAETFDNKGAYLDIGVTKDSAIITIYALNKYLDELLPIVGDMLNTAIFPNDEIEIHIERQKQEFLTNNEKVRYKAMFEFNSLVFGHNSAYGQQLILDDFDKLNKQDLLNFYQSRYTPGNAYVIVSGKLNKRIVSSINKNIGNNWERSNLPFKQPEFTHPVKSGKSFIKKEGAMQSALRVGRPIMSKTHPDYHSFLLLNTILGGYFGSRLMSNLREDKGFTYGVSSFVASFINAGYFSISTEVNAKHTRDALDEIYKELEYLRVNKIGEDELNLVKNYISGTFLRNFDGPFALAERYRSVKDFGLSFDFYKKSLNEIQKVDAIQLQEVANKYLNAEDMIQLVVGNIE